jgi:hypothetical protein
MPAAEPAAGKTRSQGTPQSELVLPNGAVLSWGQDGFAERGFCIVRGCVPAAELPRLRQHYEGLVRAARAALPEEWAPGQHQPRVQIENAVVGSAPLAAAVAGDNAAVVEVWLGGMRAAAAVCLGVPDPTLAGMSMLCSPEAEPAPRSWGGWHRDFNPTFSCPLEGYTADIAETGPRQAQWNTALYDDEVLWVVPGSHRRLTSPAEAASIAADAHAPPPGAVQVRLRAGDGVCYSLPILHWASRYSATPLRRTLHGNYHAHGWSAYLDSARTEAGVAVSAANFVRHLQPESQAAFQRWHALSAAAQNQTERALRAAAATAAAAAAAAAAAGGGGGGDGPAAQQEENEQRRELAAALEALRPGGGPRTQLLTLMFLSKTARRVCGVQAPDTGGLTAEDIAFDISYVHPTTLDWGKAFAARFSPTAAAAAWTAFRPLADALRAAETATSDAGGGGLSYDVAARQSGGPQERLPEAVFAAAAALLGEAPLPPPPPPMITSSGSPQDHNGAA